MIQLLVIIISYFFTGTTAQKFLVLNDIHFAPNLSLSLHCHWGDCTDMGMKNNENDSPLKLINFVLDQAQQTLENIDGTKKPIDGVIITGDFVRHHFYYLVTNYSLGLPSKKHNGKSGGLTANQKLEAIKVIWEQTFTAIQKRFPNVPIMPTFGNNDFMRNYAAPQYPTNASEAYFIEYEFLYNLWLKNNEKHLTAQQIENIKISFWNGNKTVTTPETLQTVGGGWYEFPINDKLSVMCLNSIYFSDRGVSGLLRVKGLTPLADSEPAMQQLNWMEGTLANNSLSANPRKYIIMMHIPPGLNYFIQDPEDSPVQAFWVPMFQEKYIKTVAAYQENIIIGLGAHIHRADIKAQVSEHAPDLKYITFLTPSISPIYNNNPSFTLMELEPNALTISKLISWSFDLTAYTLFRSERWTKYDWISEFNLDFSTTDKAVIRIRELYQDMMNDPYLFGQYTAACYGMNWIETRMNQLGGLYYLLKSPLIQLGPTCCNTFMEPTHKDLKVCWENNLADQKFMLPETVQPTS